MTDRQKEKEELMEKVFGKNAPNRSITKKDIEILSNTKTTLKGFENQLEDLRKQIITDFPEETKNDELINITINQDNLFATFARIEQELNNTIPHQNEFIANICKAFKRPFVSGHTNGNLNTAILLIGQKGTLRHVTLTALIKQLHLQKLLLNDTLKTIDISKYSHKEQENNFIMDLYAALSNTDTIIFDNIDTIAPNYLSMMEEIITTGKLSLQKRYILNNNQLVENTNTLSKNSIDSISFSGKNLIYITTIKQTKLLTILGNRFMNALSDIIETSAYDEKEIVDLFLQEFTSFKQKCFNKLNYQLFYDDLFLTYLSDNYDGTNSYYVNNILKDVYTALSEYRLTNPSSEIEEIKLSINNQKITFKDLYIIDYLLKQKETTIQEVQKELDEIVGLEEVKKYISSLQDFYQAQKLKQAKGLNTSDISKHMIFTGNPGTGKTTIARLLAKYLKAINILSNGQLVEVSRNNLVGKYVGHTAPLTMQVINSAIGGILFIDEAYSLYRGENDSFGLECIDTLVKAMEDNRENLIVILAGYTKEMQEFLTANSGLQSRFPNQIEFPDYTGEQLYQIALINAKNAGYTIDSTVEKDLIDYFTRVQEDNSQRSGNGRFARNVIEKAIMHQSSRILKDNDDITVLRKIDFTIIEEKK